MIQTRQSHWDNIYKTKDPKQVSWFKPHLDLSLQMILDAGIRKQDPLIDIGGGASTLVDDLSAKGFSDLTVLDISGQALEASKTRLGKKAQNVRWIEGDITDVTFPKASFALWHDRAVFHFLTDPADRIKYLRNLQEFIRARGHIIIAAFSPDGPPQCSGLDVTRYSPALLQATLGSRFELLDHLPEEHTTPGGNTQKFIYCHFQLT